VEIVDPTNTLSGLPEVQSGQLTIGQVLAMNPKITNEDLIHPGDQIVVGPPPSATTSNPTDATGGSSVSTTSGSSGFLGNLLNGATNVGAGVINWVTGTLTNFANTLGMNNQESQRVNQQQQTNEPSSLSLLLASQLSNDPFSYDPNSNGPLPMSVLNPLCMQRTAKRSLP